MTLDITEVWNPASLAFSAVAGLLLGWFAIGRYATDPSYASGQASPREYGVLVASLAIGVGLVFFGFQVLGTYIDGDPGWTRVVSRFFIWMLYCVMIGVGTTGRLHYHVGKRRATAHQRAVTTLEKDELDRES